MTFKSDVEREIARIKKTRNPSLKWKTKASQFSLLPAFAMALLDASPQSASVERVCKAHGVLHTKMRSPLEQACADAALLLHQSVPDQPGL